ncbi:MAG: aldo/keto reductase, partial [Chthoniobacterales bacterium]|nr:aldo/keto reductase [Chthoniobacterales bacterium]
VKCSEVGFGVWTVSTGWWGNFTDEEAICLLREAREVGITLFDAADTYGNGRSEELLGKAFPPGASREGVVFSTKVGYDFVNHGQERRGQREIPQDFRPDAVRKATEAALRRMRVECVDVLQLHNIRMEQVEDDLLWECLEKLRDEGKVRAYGVALGPAIGWLAEGVLAIRRRNPHIVQHIYNYLEQYPGKRIQQEARNCGAKTRFFIRVPHSSGMLEGRYTEDTVFPPGDHRSHRPRAWLTNGLKKVEKLRFLERNGRSLGQAAIQWLLADDRVVSVLPNIYNREQIIEFANASEAEPLSNEELAKMEELYTANFGLPPEEQKFKGTMILPEEIAEVKH